MRAWIGAAAAALAAQPAAAEDLYRNGGWPALTSDRVAQQPGDILTVLVVESASGNHSAETGSERDTRLEGGISIGSALSESGGIEARGGTRGRGRTERTGQMVARLSVTVEDVLPNGDLAIAGTHALTINRERTTIKLRGRVRRADISAENTVLSARIADAVIEYDGAGYVSRTARPGIVQRIFGFLGLM